ncbi:hypothetical protein [uncultured Desulfobacter sp.]|uniref:hypothetical protein n=1 Tax=uncultured Desulfobacter sp. TaxID=240139 RepID=UPI002AAA8334|nr:hypothetical protein [uncultured Desulfobacter sp.]
MSKIVAATNSMIANSDKISTVINSDSYWFFLYDKKYAWCVENLNYEGTNSSILYFLKAEGKFYVNDLKTFERLSRQDVRLLVKQGEAIEYNSNEIGTDEALQAFRLLFTTVKEKGFGIDNILDDIKNIGLTTT